MSNKLSAVLRARLALLPRIIAQDLELEDDDPAWIADMCRQYEAADEDSRRDMMAFHGSGGVAQVRESVRKVKSGEMEGGA